MKKRLYPLLFAVRNGLKALESFKNYI